MLKQVIRRLRTGMIVCLLVLSLLATVSPSAQAGKAVKSLVFDTAPGTIEVAAIYETSYAAQKSVVKSLKIGSKLMKKAAGFRGSSVLRSQDGKQVIAFSQWKDLTSYQAYTPTLTADSTKATTAVSSPPTPTQTLVFEVATTRSAIAGATPALRGKEAVIQLAQFVPKTPDARSRLLTRVEAMILAILQKQPIPQSVVLVKGVNNGDIALLTNWNCSALFEDVGQPTEIELSSDLVALIDSEQHLYNVVNIIPAEVEDKESKDD